MPYRARTSSVSTKVANLAVHGAEYGVSAHGLTVDIEGVRARKRAMVDEEIAFIVGSSRQST
jgi:hypothetical protein